MDTVKKILILSSGRAGSTTLTNALKYSIKNTQTYFEPFNPEFGIVKDNKSYNKHVLDIEEQSFNKVIISKEIIPAFTYHFKLNIELTLFYINNYVNKFDRVILLARENQKKAIESFSYAMLTKKWHEKYSLNNIKDIPVDVLEGAKNRINISNQLLNTISFKGKFPVIYYEDLFSGNKDFILSFLKIYNLNFLVDSNTFFKWLNPKNKYRNE